MTAGKRTAHQSRFGQSYCVPCDPGLYAAEAGAAVCSPCQRGSFVNSSTATRCFSCGQEEVWTTSKAVQVGEQERWIEVEGASSESSCRCVQGRYLSEGQCEICPLGSSCPGSGNLTLLPGFYSTESQPGAVLECFGNPVRCPGGSQGTCATGRDSTSPACSSCLPGLQPNNAGECVQCTGGDYAALLTLALVVLLGTAILHISLALLDRTSGSYHSALLSAALCLNQLITCAQLFAVLEQMQSISWTDPFLSFLQFFRILSPEAFLDSVKTIGCITRISSEVTFLIRTVAVPLFFAIGPLIVHLMIIRTSFALHMSSLMKTYGFLFVLFYITLSAAFVEPFRCNVHPNGSLTMQTAHSVFCTFSGTHLTLGVMSGLICLLPISFLVMCSWVLVTLPRRVAQETQLL